VRGTEAHLGAGLAELVCSNSFRSDDPQRNTVGLLHEEMRQCGSLILRAADQHKGADGRGNLHCFRRNQSARSGYKQARLLA
jgi:folate-dependent tRNA-U54 methylase TrmFO/GidA